MVKGMEKSNERPEEKVGRLGLEKHNTYSPANRETVNLDGKSKTLMAK